MQTLAKVLDIELTQGKFQIQERNAKLAVDAYLTPVQQVFQFLEDISMIKAFSCSKGRPLHAFRINTYFERCVRLE